MLTAVTVQLPFTQTSPIKPTLQMERVPNSHLEKVKKTKQKRFGCCYFFRCKSRTTDAALMLVSPAAGETSLTFLQPPTSVTTKRPLSGSSLL